jgi:hypothetical protein
MARVVELAVRSTSGKFVRGMTAYSILKRAGFSKNQVEEFFGYVEHHSGVGKIISVPDADRLRRAKWAFLLPDQSASAAPAVAAAAPVSIKPRMLTVSEPFLVLRGQLEADSAQSWILAQLAVGIKTIGHDANGDYMLRAVLVSTPLPGDWSRRGIYVFDMAEAETRAKFAQTLLTVLSSPNVAKVFHDARLDGDALRRLLSRETSKFVMKSVVDTQMMFAMLVEANVVHLRTPAKLPFASLEDALMALALPVARVTDDASRTVHERWKAPAPLTAALLSSVEQRFLEPLLGLHARLVRQFDVNVGLLSSMNVRWFGAQASVTVPGKPALVGEVHALSFSANDNNARPSTRVQVVLEPLSECGGRPSARGLPPPDEATRNRQMDETTELLSSLPRNVYDAIWSLCDGDVVQLSTNLAEVRMECGRPATLVWRTGATQELPYELVESDFLRFTSAVISENGFTLRADNRVAMSRLLHRVSVARDSQLQIAHARARACVCITPARLRCCKTSFRACCATRRRCSCSARTVAVARRCCASFRRRSPSSCRRSTSSTRTATLVATVSSRMRRWARRGAL